MGNINGYNNNMDIVCCSNYSSNWNKWIVWMVRKEKVMKQIIISENKKRNTKMVVNHTVVKGQKNRKGEPYIISETKHIKGK